MADFQIRTDTASLADKRAARKRQKSTQRIIVITVAAVLVFVGLMVRTIWKAPPEPLAQTDGDSIAVGAAGVEEPASNQNTSDATVDAQPMVIDDDGHTMWVSPTTGAAIDLSGLPPGCEMFVALRPAALLASPDGDKLLAALGPLGHDGRATIESCTNLHLADIEHLLIGLRPADDFAVDTTLVVTPITGVQGELPATRYRLSDITFVVAPEAILDEVRDLNGATPPLRREIESLVGTSDRDRHATMIVAPTYLFGSGRKMWHGPVAGLRDPLFAMLPDSTRGVALSLHTGDDFFAELRLVSTIDVRPQQFARQTADRVASWPSLVEREIAQVQTSAYSAAVVARLPAMLRALHRYQRTGVDGDQSLLRVYLPAPAGHNLVMAGELLLAERMSNRPVSRIPTRERNEAATLEQRLARRASVSFSRDTLETAVNLLAAEIGAPIIIRGGDLQLEGITKNQSFALDQQDQPAGEILVAILRLANPDKTATGPADAKQKLVYTLGIDPASGQPAVLVTTRSGAEKQGETLPAVFTE